MKKAITLLAVLLLALLLTNPKLSAHKAALLEKEIDGLPSAGLTNSPMVARELAATVETRTHRENYGLFSITVVNYSDTLPNSAPPDLLNRKVGVGLLGQVYLWSAM